MVFFSRGSHKKFSLLRQVAIGGNNLISANWGLGIRNAEPCENLKNSLSSGNTYDRHQCVRNVGGGNSSGRQRSAFSCNMAGTKLCYTCRFIDRS